MIIKSKKTGLEHTITPEEWDAMKDSGDSIHFVVLQGGKSLLEKKTPIALPEIEEYKRANTSTEENKKPKPIKTKQ